MADPVTLVVQGQGMLATAFLERHPAMDAVVFARGVADSSVDDPTEFAREISTLRQAVDLAAEQQRPLVYFSSAPVYGDFDGSEVHESAPARPTSSYGRHKLACEAIVRAAPGPSLILRLPNVVGPGGHPNQLVPALVRQISAGHVRIFDAAARDIIDVDDLVGLTERLLAADATDRLANLGRTVNVASGICTPVADIADRIATILERSPVRETVHGGQAQRFSTARLQSLIGEMAFEPDYAARVLTLRVPVIAATLFAPTAEAAVSAGR